jgi:hypothetical protein
MIYLHLSHAQNDCTLSKPEYDWLKKTLYSLNWDEFPIVCDFMEENGVEKVRFYSQDYTPADIRRISNIAPRILKTAHPKLYTQKRPKRKIDWYDDILIRITGGRQYVKASLYQKHRSMDVMNVIHLYGHEGPAATMIRRNEAENEEYVRRCCWWLASHYVIYKEMTPEKTTKLQAERDKDEQFREKQIAATNAAFHAAQERYRGANGGG